MNSETLNLKWANKIIEAEPYTKYYGRTCAICGKVIRKADICSMCFNLFREEILGKKEWVMELIKFQSSYERKKANNEYFILDKIEENVLTRKIDEVVVIDRPSKIPIPKNGTNLG